MAATRSNPTFVYVACAFLTTMCIIFASVAWLASSDYDRLDDETRQVRDELKHAKSSLLAAEEDRQAVRDLLGYGNLEVGPGDGADRGTLVDQTRADIHDAVGDGPHQTVRDALLEMSARVKDARSTSRAFEKDKQELEKEVLALETRWKSIVAVQKGATDNANRRVVDTLRSNEEVMKSRSEQIETLSADNLAMLARVRAMEEQLDVAAKEFDERRRNMQAVIRKLKQRQDDLNDYNFEVADGSITHIDRSQKLAWIDVGSRDKLPIGLKFGVFPRGKTGVGRNSKCSLEVVRISGPGMAQAKIIGESPAAPLLTGDVIYTPVWSPGRTEGFAFAGVIDLDGDGLTDVDRIRSQLAQVGATVKSWVDDEGNRHGSDVDVDTKFLVMGREPDVNKSKTAAQKQTLEAMLNHLTDMRREAEENGVRIVSLSDFRDFIGSRSGARLIVPGGRTVPRATTPARNRSDFDGSTGFTSGRFRSKRLREPQ